MPSGRPRTVGFSVSTCLNKLNPYSINRCTRNSRLISAAVRRSHSSRAGVASRGALRLPKAEPSVSCTSGNAATGGSSVRYVCDHISSAVERGSRRRLDWGSGVRMCYSARRRSGGDAESAECKHSVCFTSKVYHTY